MEKYSSRLIIGRDSQNCGAGDSDLSQEKRETLHEESEFWKNSKGIEQNFQYNYPLTDNIFIKSNFRYESNEYSYLGDTYLQDSVLNPVVYNIKDHMMGYKAAITYKLFRDGAKA